MIEFGEMSHTKSKWWRVMWAKPAPPRRSHQNFLIIIIERGIEFITRMRLQSHSHSIRPSSIDTFCVDFVASRVHFICTSGPRRPLADGNDADKRRRERLRGGCVTSAQQQRVGAGRVWCAAASMENRKKHKIGISFASNTLFSVVSNILDAFVRQTKFSNFFFREILSAFVDAFGPCACVCVWRLV